MTDANSRLSRRRWLQAFSAMNVAGLYHCSQRSTHTTRTVRLGVAALRISLPVFVALEQQLFRRHGVDVEARIYPTAQPLVDDVVHQHIDVGGYAAWPIVFLASMRAAVPVRVGSALVEDEQHRISYVLTRTGSGLQFPRDVVGRRIGVLPTVAYRRWIVALLQAAHQDPSQTTVVPIEPAMQAETLARGGVDFLFTNDPMATAILQRNIGTLAEQGPVCPSLLGSPFGFGTFLWSGAFAAQNPTGAMAVLRGIDDAIVRLRADPQLGRNAMRNYLRPEERNFVDHYPPARYLTSSEFETSALQGEFSREHSLGIIEHTPRVQRFPDTAP